MTLSTRDIEGVLRSVLPAGDERFELRLAPGEPVFETGDGGVRARLLLLVFEDGSREVRDVKEQEMYLLNATERADEARTTAFLRAWGRSLATIVQLQFGGEADCMLPCDLLFHEALFEAEARTEADFLALFESAEWLAQKCEAREGEEFTGSLAHLGLAEHAQQLRALWRPSIRLVVDADRHADADEDDGYAVEDDSAIGESRIGGLPDLPADAAWPRIEGAPLAFLAQINLAELRGLPGAKELPDSGLLAFFYDADGRTNHDAEGKWCWPVRHRGGAQVLYFAGDPATFVRTAAPTDVDDPPHVFPAYPVLERVHERMLPSLESPFYEVLDDEPHEQPWYSRIAQVAELSEDDRERPIHRVLGYTSELQGDPYLEAHMYSTGRTFDGWQHNGARERALKREATQWRLLLQIDSTPGDLLCQDGGYFYFLIRAEDLAARRFDLVWGISHGH